MNDGFLLIGAVVIFFGIGFIEFIIACINPRDHTSDNGDRNSRDKFSNKGGN